MESPKSKNLKEFLQNHRYTYRAFGAKVGVSGQSVLHWVNGRSLPIIENARKIFKQISFDERCSARQAEKIFYNIVDKR